MDILQGYSQRIRLQRRIYTVCELIFMSPSNHLPNHLTSHLKMHSSEDLIGFWDFIFEEFQVVFTVSVCVGNPVGFTYFTVTY